MIAFYVAFDRADAKAFEEKWNAWQPDVRLVTYYSPYRSITQPLIKFIDKVEHQCTKTGHKVTVVIPQFYRKRVAPYATQPIESSHSYDTVISQKCRHYDSTFSFIKIMLAS